MATSTVEDYLKAILLEEQAGGSDLVATGRVAQALALQPSTVTAMMKALADGGLVEHERYAGVRLTPSGRKLALHVLRRHRLVELFLVEVLGFDWSEVHDEAERLEHAVSDRLIDRIDEMLGRPAVDPHGDPIPTAALEVAAGAGEPLSELPAGVRARVTRVGDQDAGFLRRVDRLGLSPGARLKVVERDADADTLDLDLGRGRRVALGLRAAAKITVERG